MCGSSHRSEVGRAKPGNQASPCNNSNVVAPQSDSHFADDLRHLAATLEDLELDGLDAESGGFRTKRERLIRSIEAYLVPRLTDPTMPVVVVFAGPTGSGKSTLVNSISGVEVSETGPLRPTTRGPVVLTSAENAARFVQISGLECEVVVGRSEILSQMAFIDTPDIDSTSAENRATAEILIDTADIVVFVTSVLRYADLVPWEVLRRAKSRGAAVISVLNRVNAGSAGAGIDFRSLLTRQDMSSDIIRVPEHYVAPGSHRLPALTVRELQRRLLEAAQALDATQQQIFDKVLDSTIGQVLDLGDRLEDMLERADQIRARVRSGLLEALSVLELGSMCEGVGPPDPPHRPLPKAIWRLRSRLSASQWRDLRLKLRSRLVALVEQEIRRASLGLTGFSPLGGQTIDDLRAMTAAACDAWIDEIEDIARLARLEVRDEEFATYAKDLSRIIDLVKDLHSPIEHLHGFAEHLRVRVDLTEIEQGVA